MKMGFVRRVLHKRADMQSNYNHSPGNPSHRKAVWNEKLHHGKKKNYKSLKKSLERTERTERNCGQLEGNK